MNYAVIESGSKQYLVTNGDVIRVEKLETEAGKKIDFANVHLMAAGDVVTMGTPLVKGAKVEGTVVRHGRHPKVTGVKMKAKKRNRKFFGHKQHFTEIEITKISVK